MVRFRDALANHASPSSFAGRARAARWRMLLNRFPHFEEMRILDLGGTATAWSIAPRRPQHVTLVNISEQRSVDEGWMKLVVGDACNPPEEVRREHYDLVYSNSAIEHLGGHVPRTAFAEVVRASGDHHWIQTPNRYFPIEPHWLFPGFQFLPVSTRSFICKNWRMGWYSRPQGERSEVVESVLSIELLSATEMAHYFFDSEILRERVAGVTKSFIAVR